MPAGMKIEGGLGLNAGQNADVLKEVLCKGAGTQPVSQFEGALHAREMLPS
jgi:hypothetical protein